MLPKQCNSECIHIYDACINADIALESARHPVSTSASITLFSPTSSRNLLSSFFAPLCLNRTAVSMMPAIRSMPAVCVALSVVNLGSSVPIDCAQGVTCSRTALVGCEGVTVICLAYSVIYKLQPLLLGNCLRSPVHPCSTHLRDADLLLGRCWYNASRMCSGRTMAHARCHLHLLGQEDHRTWWVLSEGAT